MMRRNILLKKRIGCLLAAALLAGEIGSASMVAVAAPVEKTQTSVENQVENSQKVVEIPEEYITFGEPVVSEPDAKVEEVDAAKSQLQGDIQEEIPVIRPVVGSKTESLDAAKVAEDTELGEVQEEVPMIFPESIPVLGGGITSTEVEMLDAARNSGEPVPNQPDVSEVTREYTSISVNDVISGSGHNGIFEPQYLTFTPKTSGYYGFYTISSENCSVHAVLYDNENFDSGSWENNGDIGVYSCFSLNADQTYWIELNSNSTGVEYSYELSWRSFETTTLTMGENEATIGQEMILKGIEPNALYSIRLESENEFDYVLKPMDGLGNGVVLNSGEENFFFYNGYSELCLRKDVNVEDSVDIIIEKISATEYESDYTLQEVPQYEVVWTQTKEYYSFFYYTPDEDGMYAVAVEKGTGINVYEYNEEAQRMETYDMTPTGGFGGYMCSLEAGKTYYFLFSMSQGSENGKVNASIRKKEHMSQDFGTTVTYTGENVISLKVPGKFGKGYKVIVEKPSNEQYGFCSTFNLGSYTDTFSKTKDVFTGMVYGEEVAFVLTKCDHFDVSEAVKVTIEEVELPTLKKDVLYSNKGDSDLYKEHMVKFEVDETGTYELAGIVYDNWDVYADIYETNKENATSQIDQIAYIYFDDMTCNMKMELDKDKIYYMVLKSHNSGEIGEFCFYLTEPSNYEIDFSAADKDSASCEMKLLKSAEISMTISQNGFYELSANGGEEHYEVSCPGMEAGLALYKEQPKTVYFSEPGTYTVRISREFLAEDMKSDGYLDEVTFSVQKKSNMESISVYDGTEETEIEVTLREAGDYNWYSFTPQNDGCYTITNKNYDSDYGYCDKYVYELKEDSLEYIYYSNNMYELEGGKTYYIKVDTYDSEGVNQHLVFLESPVKELALNESVSVQTHYAMLVKANIEESGIYELTLTADTKKKINMSGSVNDSYYSWSLAKNKPVGKTLYLGKGEVDIPIRKVNSDLTSIGLTVKLEKMDVQEGEQDITTDKQMVWVKYTPTETQSYLVGTSNAINEIGEVITYYEADNQLYETTTNCSYENNNFYGIFDFKKDVTYFLKMESYEWPNEFHLYIKPVEQIQALTLANNEVHVKNCTQIQYDEKVTNGFYEIKVTDNTSPLTLHVKSENVEAVYQCGVNGSSVIFEMDDDGDLSDILVTMYNFSGEETDAKVTIEKIEPVERELSLDETFTRTVEGKLEIYSFTPEESGYYTVAMDGISEIEMCQQGDDYRELLEVEDVRSWEAGNTYYFYMIESVGTEFSLDIQQVRPVYFYDYSEYSAFIASGGSITIMNSEDLSEEQWEDYYNDYSDINQLGDDKVLVLSSQDFVNRNDRWYPGYLYSRYIDTANSTYGDIQQYIETSYRGKKYEGLYNEALKKVNASDRMTNPHMAVVKYIPEYVAVQQIKLTGPTVMKVGDTITLQAVLDTMNEYAPTNATVTWSSSNSNVIAVNAKGEIIAKAPGTATITVKSNDKLGRFATIKIDVYQDAVYAKAVSISGPKNVYVGDSIQLTATVTGQNNATPTVNGVTWTTSDTRVARVDANGKVKGLKQGTVTITATSKDGKATGTYVVNVQNVMEQKISLNESKITMKKGTKYTWLKVTFKPENTTDKTLYWKTSNKRIVSVNDEGVLKANGIGKATITVTSENGKTAKVNVTVTKYAVKIKKLSTTSKKTMMEGEKVTLPLEVKPVNATNQKMKWKSSNEEVATVNSKGVVTAKKAGKATITATAQDGSKKIAKCVISVKELAKANDVKAKSNKKKTVEISWNPVADADGYVVYMATEKNGKYKKIATTKKDKTSYTKTKLKSKKTYYFKVCAINKVGKKQYEGKMSKVAKVKVK